MPTPIGHALGGLIVGLIGAGRAGGPSRESIDRGRDPTRSTQSSVLPDQADPPNRPGLRDLAWPALTACLPDVDFLWGRHNMETHSLAFAVLVGVAVWVWTREARLSLLCAIAVGTHVLFDWLGSDDSPPLGVMALWPLSSEFYFANAFVFEAISRRYWLPNFFTHNLLAVLRELAILVPPVIAAWYIRLRQFRAAD